LPRRAPLVRGRLDSSRATASTEASWVSSASVTLTLMRSHHHRRLLAKERRSRWGSDCRCHVHCHHRRCRPEGFMVAARLPQPAPPAQRHPSHVSHPACVLVEPDEEGFYEVRSYRCWRCCSPPKLARLVPPELVGLCFNCLAKNHVKAECIFLAKCYNYLGKGHRASSCPLPPRLFGAKRGRSPPQAGGGGRRRGSRRQRVDTVD
jgi:hypothetical protein